MIALTPPCMSPTAMIRPSLDQVNLVKYLDEMSGMSKSDIVSCAAGSSIDCSRSQRFRLPQGLSVANTEGRLGDQAASQMLSKLTRYSRTISSYIERKVTVEQKQLESALHHAKA